MIEEQIKQKFKETYPDFMRGDEALSPYFDIWEYGIEIATKELQEENEQLKKKLVQTQDAVTMQMYTNEANKKQSEMRIADLEKKVEKGRNIIHKLLVVVQRHKWWDYTVIDEARAFMSEVDRDKDHD